MRCEALGRRIIFLRRFNISLGKGFCNLSHFSFPESDHGKDTQRIFRGEPLPARAGMVADGRKRSGTRASNGFGEQGQQVFFGQVQDTGGRRF